MVITLGSDDARLILGQEIRVKRVAVPEPDNCSHNISIDFALIQLSKPVLFSSKIYPICLAPDEYPPRYNESRCVALEYGEGMV